MDVSYDEDKLLKLSSDWLKILHNDSFNDVCIKLHDGEVFANKVVLSVRSEYFAASLRWKENNSNKEIEDSRHEIVLENCSTKIMTLIIEYYYSGIIKVNDLTIIELFELREQVRLLFPGEKLDKEIEDLITETFEELNIIELLEIRGTLRTLLPSEEFFLQDYIDHVLIQVIDDEDDVYSRRRERSFFLTNEEVINLINSDQLDDHRKEELCELFQNLLREIYTSRCQAMRASLVVHGVLKSVTDLILHDSMSISLIPEDQLKTLISSTTDRIEIEDEENKIKTLDRDIIFTNVQSKSMELIYLDLTKRETELLVTAMGSRVEEITLAGVELYVKTFLEYQGNGKCKQIDILNYGFCKDNKVELLAWCKQKNWTMKRNDRGSDRIWHMYDFDYGIRLERNAKL